MPIYSIIRRSFSVETCDLSCFLSSPLESGYFSIGEENCYVYFHFGDLKDYYDENIDVFSLCSLQESMEFVKEIEKKFRINVNFVNFESIVRGFTKFNSGKAVKVFFDDYKQVTSILIDEYVRNLEKYLWDKLYEKDDLMSKPWVNGNELQ